MYSFYVALHMRVYVRVADGTALEGMRLYEAMSAIQLYCRRDDYVYAIRAHVVLLNERER
jgi:hypothetical protein